MGEDDGGCGMWEVELEGKGEGEDAEMVDDLLGVDRRVKKGMRLKWKG